ncbi:MAG TPA: ABC transporter permease [Candidatus Polarisedimenticolia bacterium]|nr:ABC transporter permease [Candidatus Polarisedimenticolia bacterium]
MHKLLMVIRREYLERIRTRSFWLGTLLFPLLMLGLVVLQIVLADVETAKELKVGFADATGKLGPELQAALTREEAEAAGPQTKRQGKGDEAGNEKTGREEKPTILLEILPLEGDLEQTRKRAEPRVLSGNLFGVLTAGTDLDSDSNFRFYTRSVGNIDALRTLRSALRQAVVAFRLEQSNVSLSPDLRLKILKPVEIDSFEIKAQGEAKKRGFMEAYMGTFAFVLILYMSLLLYGIAVMRGILEEKSNRVMEVLLGSVSTDQLMTGKIVGIGLVGLTQLAIYVATATFLRVYVGLASLQTGWTGALDAVSPANLGYFCVFFLLGYFLYTSMFAAVGAVCNSEQEAQNLQSPLVMCLVVPMVMTFFFVQNPDSPAAVVASLIPIFAPMVMFMRITILTPPLWQIALSILILLVTIYFFFRGVARVFRIGVLMYGKRPTVPEILRWARG